MKVSIGSFAAASMRIMYSKSNCGQPHELSKEELHQQAQPTMISLKAEISKLAPPSVVINHTCQSLSGVTDVTTCAGTAPAPLAKSSSSLQDPSQLLY